MPFQSRAQQHWAFATGQPFAHEWGEKTKKEGGFKGLPQYAHGRPKEPLPRSPFRRKVRKAEKPLSAVEAFTAKHGRPPSFPRALPHEEFVRRQDELLAGHTRAMQAWKGRPKPKSEQLELPFGKQQTLVGVVPVRVPKKGHEKQVKRGIRTRQVGAGATATGLTTMIGSGMLHDVGEMNRFAPRSATDAARGARQMRAGKIGAVTGLAATAAGTGAMLAGAHHVRRHTEPGLAVYNFGKVDTVDAFGVDRPDLFRLP